MVRKKRLVCAGCRHEFWFLPERFEAILERVERRYWRCRECAKMVTKFDAYRRESELPAWKLERMVPEGATVEPRYRDRRGQSNANSLCGRCGRSLGSSDGNPTETPGLVLCNQCVEIERQRFER